jgi:Zn-dependent protease
VGLLNLLAKDPALFGVLAVLLLYSVIAHEVAHGWVALLFGDDTARQEGRLTPNPIPHIDPLGLLMLLAVGFGWARPVPVNYGRLRGARAGLAAVALAGPLTNILIASAAIFLLRQEDIRAAHLLGGPLAIAAKINIVLAAFNLIPIPPLDGSKVLGEFLPGELRVNYLKLERFGFLIVIALLFTGLLDPVIRFMEKAVFGLITAALSGF